jgi:glutaredoxin
VFSRDRTDPVKEVTTLRKVKLYALSTCGWCRKTKRFLDDNDVDYQYEYLDLLTGNERVRALAEVEQYNRRKSFPTLVVQNDDTHVVIGYKESRLREVLGL